MPSQISGCRFAEPGLCNWPHSEQRQRPRLSGDSGGGCDSGALALDDLKAQVDQRFFRSFASHQGQQHVGGRFANQGARGAHGGQGWQHLVTAGQVIEAGNGHLLRYRNAQAQGGQQGALRLHVGDHLRLTRGGLGQPSAMDDDTDTPSPEPAHLAVTLPQVIDQARVGERIWFDDGRIGGVIRLKTDDWLDIEITQARPEGEKLTGDKGINLPDSKLNLPALSDKDIEDLKIVATQADMVGLSFVQKPSDVALLRDHLQRLGRENMGIVPKIETLQGFENLPELMLSAMASPVSGVMIARGDLAVECGYERLAEVQEEILWCAESAHMPVIWATQVLEFMAKTGLPSRAEISYAGLGVRAKCVMLNKGPYISQAIRTLDDILQRMGGHQAKKRPLLRALKAWSSPDTPASGAMLGNLTI